MLLVVQPATEGVERLDVGIARHGFDAARAERDDKRLKVGARQERVASVRFLQYDLGYFDDETCRLEPIAYPFGPKVLPVRSE
jgi:hypothetical protein